MTFLFSLALLIGQPCLSKSRPLQATVRMVSTHFCRFYIAKGSSKMILGFCAQKIAVAMEYLQQIGGPASVAAETLTIPILGFRSDKKSPPVPHNRREILGRSLKWLRIRGLTSLFGPYRELVAQDCNCCSIRHLLAAWPLKNIELDSDFYGAEAWSRQ